MGTRTIADAGGNYSSAGTWVEGAVPTAADDVVATPTSGPLTIDVNSVCRSADFTGYTNVLTHAASVNWTIGDASGGALKFVSGMTYTRGSTTSSALVFVSTAGSYSITTAGKPVGNVTFNGVGGSWSLADDFDCGVLTFLGGTFTANNKNVSARSVTASSGSLARNITGGTGTWTLTVTGTVWSTTATTNLTFNFSNTNIVIGNTAASTKTFVPASGQAFGSLTWIVGAAASQLSITDNCTITTITVVATPGFAKTLRITAGKTVTSTNARLEGVPGAPLTIDTSSAGSAATISVASGTVRANHASIKDSTASGGATFEAWDSVSVSNNTGWTFEAPKKMALAGVG